MRADILRIKFERQLINRQVKKDEQFAPPDKIVVRKSKRTEWLGMEVLDDEEYRKKYYE